MSKAYKELCSHFSDMVGEQGAGLIIASIMDALVKKSKESGGSFVIRKLTMTLNDYFDFTVYEEAANDDSAS